MEIVTTAFNYDLDWLDKTNLPITLVRMNGCNEIRLPAKFSVIDTRKTTRNGQDRCY